MWIFWTLVRGIYPTAGITRYICDAPGTIPAMPPRTLCTRDQPPPRKIVSRGRRAKMRAACEFILMKEDNKSGSNSSFHYRVLLAASRRLFVHEINPSREFYSHGKISIIYADLVSRNWRWNFYRYMNF